MLRDGGVRGKLCPIKGRERLNIAHPSYVFYNEQYKITLVTSHQVAIAGKMINKIINYFMAMSNITMAW